MLAMHLVDRQASGQIEHHLHLALHQQLLLLVWTGTMHASNAVEVSTPVAGRSNVAGTNSMLRQACNRLLSSGRPGGSRPTWLASLRCQQRLSAWGDSGCGRCLAGHRTAWGSGWGLRPVPACTASSHTSPGSLDSGGQGSALQT